MHPHGQLAGGCSPTAAGPACPGAPIACPQNPPATLLLSRSTRCIREGRGWPSGRRAALPASAAGGRATSDRRAASRRAALSPLLSSGPAATPTAPPHPQAPAQAAPAPARPPWPPPALPRSRPQPPAPPEMPALALRVVRGGGQAQERQVELGGPPPASVADAIAAARAALPAGAWVGPSQASPAVEEFDGFVTDVGTLGATVGGGWEAAKAAARALVALVAWPDSPPCAAACLLSGHRNTAEPSGVRRLFLSAHGWSPGGALGDDAFLCAPWSGTAPKLPLESAPASLVLGGWWSLLAAEKGHKAREQWAGQGRRSQQAGEWQGTVAGWLLGSGPCKVATCRQPSLTPASPLALAGGGAAAAVRRRRGAALCVAAV